MQLAPVSETVAHAGLRALYTVAMADGEVSPLETAFIEAVREHVLHVAPLPLRAITGAELAAAVPAGEARQRIVGGAVLASCIDGQATKDEVAVLEDFARALDVDPAPVRTARRLAREQLVLARFDIARRSLPGHKIRQTVREEGLLALAKQLWPTLGGHDDAMVARYRGLADAPPGTLGRAYFDFVTSNQFDFPGQPHAGPEMIVVHDCLHVIGGYGTSASEEIDVAAFQAGCHGGDPFYGILFGLAQYHLGVRVTPVAAAEKLHADPARMVKAFARGARIRRDMWSDFRPWDHFAKPLAALRAELGLDEVAPDADA